MSDDDLDIRSGGVVAVDTESLRAAARRLDELRAECERVGRMLRSAAVAASACPDFAQSGAAARAASLASRAAALEPEPEALAVSLRRSADVFELVELSTQAAAAHAAGDAAALARIEARAAELRTDRDVAQEAQRLLTAYAFAGPEELVRQAAMGPAILAPGASQTGATLLWTIAQGVRAAGLGTIGPVPNAGTTVPEPGGDPRTVRLLAATPGTSGPATAPPTLEAAVARIPQGMATIRVERYTMTDGSREFAVYVAGTKTAGGGGMQPFDMVSNLQAYLGGRSASYDAVVAALHDAGAAQGDVVHGVGHSQGGMILSQLALYSEFDVQTLVTAGSPVAADVGPQTLSVALRHTDDPVAALSGGGFAGSVGAPGSFVAERVADAVVGPTDLALPAHVLTSYEQTAAMLDASPDPRMQSVRELLGHLDAAASVVVTEYAAERLSDPSAADAE